MRIVPQLAVVALICTVAVPVAARLVPATRPWLDGAGLLTPLAALGLVPAARDEAPTRGPGGPGGRGASVLAAEVETRPLREVVTAIGSARGVQAAELSFEVAGRLAALHVGPGDHVAEGAVIADLDAEAAQLAVDRALLVLDDRQKTVDRLDQLAGSGTSTALQRQEADLALRTARLELQAARRTLADHRLTAPIAGYVGLIEPQTGDLIPAGTVLTRIEDRTSLLVDFRVPERVATRIASGDPVRATAVSDPGLALDGRIVAVDNRLDETSRTLRVQARIDNADDRLRAGMAFRIDLAFTGDVHPAVDPLAIQWGADGAFVWVVRAGKAAQVPVRILQRNADAVLVDAAFQPGDLVATEGVQALRPGADVTVVAPRS